MNGPALATMKAWLTLSSNNANRHEGTSTSYEDVINLLLMRYVTNAVIGKADEEISTFKHGLRMP